MLQNSTLLRKSAPWPPNISDEHVSCTAPATRHASLQILFNAPRLPSFLEMLQAPHVSLTSDKVHNPLCFPRKTTSERPTVVRDRQSLTLLTSKCASRHNGVQFFISHLPRWLYTRRFSGPTFRPSRATNHWKNTVFRDFATFSRTRIFCLLTRYVLWSSFFFSFLTLPTSAFSSVHIVGSLTSKLLSISIYYCNANMIFS